MGWKLSGSAKSWHLTTGRALAGIVHVSDVCGITKWIELSVRHWTGFLSPPDTLAYGLAELLQAPHSLKRHDNPMAIALPLQKLPFGRSSENAVAATEAVTPPLPHAHYRNRIVFCDLWLLSIRCSSESQCWVLRHSASELIVGWQGRPAACQATAVDLPPSPECELTPRRASLLAS